MGSSSSVLRALDFPSNKYDEYKEEPKEHLFGTIPQFNNNPSEAQSLVWFTINIINKTLFAIKGDFNKETNTELYEVLNSVMINIDSIHHICNTTFEYENIQQINKKNLAKAIKTLKEFYETKPVIVVRINKYQNIVNLDKFTYSIFRFVDTHGYLGVYV